MYLLYIDESGDPYSWRTGQQYFCLGAVAIHEGQVTTLTEKLRGIQESYLPGLAFPVAFHAHHVFCGKGHFGRLQKSTRNDLLNELYDIIGCIEFPKLIAFSTVIDASAVTDDQQALHDVFEDLCSRFNAFLKRGYKKEHKNKGLLIIDQAHETHYRHFIDEFHTSGTKYGYLDNLIDIPYFAGCEDTRMLQLADLCAYAVHRYYNFKDDNYLNKILRCFDKRLNSTKLDGFKHYTRTNCSCIACTNR
jgi:hypothetical protein